MTDTTNLSLPLLSPSQAQKHVTVNEALTRIDALVQLRLASITETTPPVSPDEGARYGVPTGAVNSWAGQEGRIAIASNGGWDFVMPQAGWRAHVADSETEARFDGSLWREAALTQVAGGGGMIFRSVAVDLDLVAGASQVTPVLFPERAIAFGVTGLVTQAITGTATSWDLGVAGDLQRYGNGLGLGVNAAISGPSAPLVYWTPTALTLSAVGGDFAGGTVRLIAHFAELGLPDWQ